ncbi:MAG: transporter, family, cyanate transporter [Actinomycetota bacterium]|nr:transporter, family, cyanate transporter [Actinomycetota bacterium]
MPADRLLPLWAGRTAALLGILLVALNLRTAVASLSPILSMIEHDVPLNPVVVGIVGAAPPLMFALAGLVSPLLSRRLGLEGLLLIAIGAMVVGQLARALAPNPTTLVVSTAVALLGAGIGNVLLPPLVKRYFSDRMTQVTTGYAVLIAFSTALPPLAAVPVATAFGWRASLCVWVALALTAILPWIVASRARARQLRLARESDDDNVVESEPALEGRLFRSPVAWAIMITFMVSSFTVYAGFAWLPSLLVDTAHVTPGQAGSLLALFAIAGFPCSLVVPSIAARLKNVGILIYVAVGLLLVGYGGLLLFPTVATPLWIVVAGLGPLLFPLALYLINQRTRTHAGSVALSGFVQGVGYLIAAASPLLFGILHQVSGGWTLSIGLLILVSLAGIPAAIILRRHRYLEDDLAPAVRRATRAGG